MGKFLAIAALALALSGCSAINKTCNSSAETKTVGILQADFGLFGQGASLAIGDICAAAAPAPTQTPTPTKAQ